MATPKRTLRWWLTRRTLYEDLEVTTPWDQYDWDVPRIVEVMMFHEAAGGDAYTGLLNRHQSFVDLSGQLNTGRAFLVGRSKRAAAILVGGESWVTDIPTQQWTFYRIVIPVD